MSTIPGRLRIAIQKSGRLSERCLDLLREAGLRVVKGNNDLLYRVENYPIDVLRVRDDDIPTFVADGVADLGIVGFNVLEEAPVAPAKGAKTIMPLGFGRCDLKNAGLVEMRGAGEVAPRLKMAHASCDLASTGATLEANGVKAFATVLNSEAM